MGKVFKIDQCRTEYVNKQMAMYLANNEISDFRAVFQLLKDQSNNSYLFRNVDLDSHYRAIMHAMQAEHYSYSSLTAQSVKGMIETYSERTDIEELRKEFEK